MTIGLVLSRAATNGRRPVELRTLAALSCLALATSCGADEALYEPTPNPSPSQADAGLDACGALRGLFEAPGVIEGLCALQQGSALQSAPNQTAIAQCQLCAAGATAVESLLPDSECRVVLNQCPVGDAAFSACLQAVGTIVGDQLPHCQSDEPAAPLNAGELALRIATSSCSVVLLSCPPLQQLVVDLLSTEQP